jgi:circadian clock protein KaiB
MDRPDTRITEAAPLDLTARRHVSERYLLRLYVTGSTHNSARAIANTRRICEEHLLGRYDLEIIDINHEADRLKADQIIAAPTLVKTLPAPLRRFIGDMSQTERILVGLDLILRAPGAATA